MTPPTVVPVGPLTNVKSRLFDVVSYQVLPLPDQEELFLASSSNTKLLVTAAVEDDA